MLNWDTIKSKINSNARQAFKNGSPSIDDVEINEAIELLKKLILHNIGVKDLNGLAKILFPAFQKIYISSIADDGALRIIADSLEPFLKKICIIGQGISYQEVEGLTLIPILKKLGINNAISNQAKRNDYPDLSETNLNTFKGDTEYLYEICNSYLIRNKVHISPDLSDLQILTFLNDLMIVYIYSTIKFKEQIKQLPTPQINSHISEQVLNGNENKMLFDFISFGNSTTEIKSQVIDAYILHSLIDNKSIDIDDLKESADKYFDKILSFNFYKRKIEKLKQSGKIEYSDPSKKTIKLTISEKIRLARVQTDFKDNKELFLLYLKDIVDNYSLSEYLDPILKKLTDFFVNNFNIDIKEIYESEINKNEIAILEDFMDYLNSITNDDRITKNLIVDLLKLCEQSDFVIRLSASKVLGKLTNPEYFQNYIRKQERIVYIDTQLILHALCIGYINKTGYENIYYQIIDELLDYSKEHPNIELRFSRLYLSEVAYQLKLAILLVPFEDVAPSNFSNNVFYLFYGHLKNNDLLEEDDDSFGAFLENWLTVNEDDALHAENDQIISSNISEILKSDLGIRITTLPYYEQRDSAVAILEETIKAKSLNPKSHHILTNDALMVCHLSNNEEHSSEPFFLTWDRTFTHYRKAFKDKFNRREAISWHLFNPSKFLNHMSLIDFKIDPKSITNEYLSILDGFGMQEKTKTIFDNMNRFLDIKNITKTQRKKYVKLTSSIFDEKEFSYEVKLPEDEKIGVISKSFEGMIDNINSFFHDSRTKYSIAMYREMLLNEDYFFRVVEIIKDEVATEINGQAKNEYKEKLILLLSEFDTIIKKQHNIL